MKNRPIFILVTVVAFALSLLLLSCTKLLSKLVEDSENDYLYKTAKTTEIWIWDRVEYHTDSVDDVYTSEEEFRDNFFYSGGGGLSFVVPYTFIFYENGYYDTCDRPYIWNLYLKDFKDGDGPSDKAQFWKIEDSYFYTTHNGWKAKRDAEFGKNYRIISNDSNTIVLQPIEHAFSYIMAPGSAEYWTVTLKKKKYRDFHYDETVWW